MSNVNDAVHRQFAHECQQAEDIIRHIVQQGNRETIGRPSFDESPLKPWIIEMAKTVLVYSVKTTSCLYGTMQGQGILLKRLPSPHESLTRWSAPLFVKLQFKGAGLMFGKETRSVFSVCTTMEFEQSFLACEGSRPLGGIEFASSCGSGMSEKTDVLTIPFGEGIDMVSTSLVHGPIFGVSFMKGRIAVDAEKNTVLYGTASAMDILEGDKVPPPHEFQPLYGELNRIVNRVEKVSINPARMSASLERFSSGMDPERVLILNDGSVMRDS